MDFQNDFDHSFLFPDLWMEPSQRQGWIISDPPAGTPATPTYTYPLQAAEIPLEPPQTSQASKIPHDQEVADPFPYDIPEIGHTLITDVGIEPNVIEPPLNRRPARKRSADLTKRRALKAQKSKRIDEIRTIMGMSCKASKLEVLNAAIQHLGGTVTLQSASANRDEQTKLAYEALHERTGSQGRLRHVQCLELVIKALKGLPTLNPIFAGQPSGST